MQRTLRCGHIFSDSKGVPIGFQSYHLITEQNTSNHTTLTYKLVVKKKYFKSDIRHTTYSSKEKNPEKNWNSTFRAGFEQQPRN